MAGFDGCFSFDPRDRDLLRSMSPLVARRARKMRIRWRLHLHPSGYAYFTMDGNTYELDLLLERLRRDLPTSAEAISSWRQPADRRRLATGLVDVVTRWRVSFYERYEEGHVPKLRGKSQAVQNAIFHVFPDSKHADLWPRLSVTSDVVSAWLMSEIPAEVVLEEIHTAAELLLTRLWGRSKRLSFAELVDHASDLGVLETSLRWDYEVEHRSEALDMKGLLIELKDHRKRVRHHGAVQADAWLKVHFWPACRVLERLAYAVSAPPSVETTRRAPTRTDTSGTP